MNEHGSTVTFILEGRKLTVDRPHPKNAVSVW